MQVAETSVTHIRTRELLSAQATWDVQRLGSR
jgi:hypothetical protein